MSEEMVTITKREYNQLNDNTEFLNCLICCGVDNWCGYSDAQEMFNEDEE